MFHTTNQKQLKNKRMKTNKLLLSFIFLISIMLSSCVDIEVSTILNADGSLERLIEVRSDSELKDYSDLPFPVDSTWKIDYKLDTTNTKKPHVYSFKKSFNSADAINKEYKKIPNGLSKFERAIHVEKKFRWFYTYLSYNETYKKMAKGNYKPFEMYLSDIEKKVRKIKDVDTLAQVLQIDSVAANDFKKGINEKYDKWLTDNLVDEGLLIVEKDMKNCHVENIKIGDLRAKRDTILKLVDSLNTKDGFNVFYQSLNKLFNTREFDKIIKAKNTGLVDFEKEIEYVMDLPGFKYKLQVPGLLIDANAESIKGNRLDWEFVPFDSYFVGTSQFAEARIINVWAFVVSGVFLVLVVGLILIPGFRRRKSL
jgi:hypothetical protein